MILVLDIGGSKTRIAVGDVDTGELARVESTETPQNYAEGLTHIVALITERLDLADPLKAVSIGIAGVIDSGEGKILKSPHLTDWEGKNLASDVSAQINTVVHLHNDVALGGLGEAKFGAGKGFPIVAYVAVGTGVGGVRIVDGHIDQASIGFETGHQLLSSGDTYIELEQLVSGSALQEKYGKSAKDLMYDPIWQSLTKDFAIGLYNTILHWSPDVVVLGGSLCSPGNIEAENVAQALTEINTALPSLPEIKYAELSGTSGLVGAVVIISQ